MKSRFLLMCGFGFGLALLPLAGGCLQNQTNAALPVQTNAAIAATATADGTAIATANSTATNGPAELLIPPGPDIASAPAKPVTTEKPVPPEIRPTPPTAEVIKLANAGVEEGVMLAYVTNSANTFNLGVDQIVYLKDIGVPGSVVTGMILHDQALKTGTASLPPSAPMLTASTTNWAPEPQAQAASAQAPPPPATVEAAPTSAPEVPPSYQTFYDNLSPYGTWIEVEGYGLVWQPTVAAINTSWRPYYDSGNWMYTDYGWYWASDYSWGWAPFHYGRWFQHNRFGWCWTPDYVWGPSWVTWRYSSAYCGWAPLPPAACYTPGIGFSYYGSSVGFSFGWGLGYSYYSYVPVGCMYYHNLPHYGVPHHQREGIHHQTVAVNRMIGDRHTVINSGIPAEHIAAATRSEVRKVPVREVSTLARGSRAEQVDASGRLSVYRPRIAPPTGTTAGTSGVAARGEVSKPGTAAAGSSSLAGRGAAWGNSGRANTAATAPASAPTRQTAPSRYSSVERPQTAPSAVDPATPASTTVRPVDRPTTSRPEVAPGIASVDRTVPSRASGTPLPGKETTTAATPGTTSRSAPLAVRGSGSTAGTTPRTAATTSGSPRTVPPRDTSRYTGGQGQSYTPPVTTAPSQPAPTRPADRPQTLYNNGSGSGGSSLQANPRYTAPARQESGSSTPAARPPATTRYVPSATPSQAPAVTPTPRSYSAPSRAVAPEIRTYSAPAPVQRSYSAPAPAPVQRSYSAPAPAQRSMPSYSAPAPRAESAPRATPSAPAPQMRSAPSPAPSAPSTPSRSSGGDGGSSKSGSPSGGSRRQN